MEEWETQRKNELVQHRQREQEKVLELKAKQEHLNTKLEEMVKAAVALKKKAAQGINNICISPHVRERR